MEMERMSAVTITPTKHDRDLLEQYQADCELQDLAPESIRRYMSCLQIFADFLTHLHLDFTQVDKQILQNFLAYLRTERKIKANTIGYYFSALSSFYEFLVYNELIQSDPVTQVRKRYLRRYKKTDTAVEKKLLSIDEMSKLVHSIMNPRDRVILMILAKTGVRRGELIRMDVEDVDRVQMSIMLKPRRKRSNRLVFIDEETNYVLGVWLQIRQKLGQPANTGPLFINQRGGRLQRNGVYEAVAKHARKLGFHDPDSPRTEDHFGPHCCRHWFTTHLRRTGMSREFRAWLRGDILRDAQDIYDHIEPDEVRREYLRCIPQFGL